MFDKFRCLPVLRPRHFVYIFYGIRLRVVNNTKHRFEPLNFYLQQSKW